MRSALWKRAVQKYVVPQLPGDWFVDGTKLVMQPVGHVARAVVRADSKAGTFYLYASLRPLFVGGTDWQSTLNRRLGGEPDRGLHLPSFEQVEDSAATMDTVVGLVISDALPYLTRHRSVEDFTALCRNTARDHPGAARVHALREQAAAQILLADTTAEDTLAEIRRIADSTPEPPPWLLDLAVDTDRLGAELNVDPEAARRSLLAVEAQTRARFKLPE